MKAIHSLSFRIRYAFLAIFTMVSPVFHAQHLNTQQNWAVNKHEISLGLGATGFLGDLGGADQAVSDYSLKDIDFNSSQLGGSFSYRYRFHRYFATSTMINAGMLQGSDAFTTEPIRNMRNLNFRSFFTMVSQRFEVVLLANERAGRNRRSGRYIDHNEQLYVVGGIGGMYFNPKARYQGSWVTLHDKYTEGQGLSGGPAPYKRITATIPLGVGFRMGIGQLWRIGLEVAYVKTFSDYIDDVSGEYYDPAMIEAAYGPDAAYLSNPSETPEAFNPGSKRGGKHKDAFFYATIMLTRNITYKSRSNRY